jgi:endonuclease YncB( thermonuclease family)
MVRRLSLALVALLTFSFLQACVVTGEPVSTPLAAVVPSPTAYATPTFPLTWTSGPPTPTNTRVIALPPTVTPGPSPTPTRLPARTKALVVGIQDSRTIEVLIEGQSISQGFMVRLLGLEPPSLSDPWAEVALAWLAQEVGRQVVVLESDARERDAQGNLLRYVWKEGHLVNVTMLQLGLATVSDNVATLRLGADLLEAQTDAQAAERGLWGPPPTFTPTPVTATATLSTTQIPTATLVSTQTPTATLTATQTPTATGRPTSSP